MRQTWVLAALAVVLTVHGIEPKPLGASTPLPAVVAAQPAPAKVVKPPKKMTIFVNGNSVSLWLNPWGEAIGRVLARTLKAKVEIRDGGSYSFGTSRVTDGSLLAVEFNSAIGPELDQQVMPIAYLGEGVNGSTFESGFWGLYGPATTTPEMAALLQSTVAQIIRSPDLMKEFERWKKKRNQLEWTTPSLLRPVTSAALVERVVAGNPRTAADQQRLAQMQAARSARYQQESRQRDADRARDLDRAIGNLAAVAGTLAGNPPASGAAIPPTAQPQGGPADECFAIVETGSGNGRVQNRCNEYPLEVIVIMDATDIMRPQKYRKLSRYRLAALGGSGQFAMSLRPVIVKTCRGYFRSKSNMTFEEGNDPANFECLK